MGKYMVQFRIKILLKMQMQKIKQWMLQDKQKLNFRRTQEEPISTC